MAQNTATGNAWGDGTDGSAVWVRPRARTQTADPPAKDGLVSTTVGHRAIQASTESADPAGATVSPAKRTSTVTTATLARSGATRRGASHR
jgi:hypothetical protein